MHDKDVATRFLFLGMARRIIQLDMNNIQNGPFKIKGPYIHLLEKMHTLATNERRKLNKIMWDKKISIIFVEKDYLTSSYKLIYNGKEEIRSYHNNIIRKYVKEILEELMKEEMTAK